MNQFTTDLVQALVQKEETLSPLPFFLQVGYFEIKKRKTLLLTKMSYFFRLSLEVVVDAHIYFFMSNTTGI
ncbi:hypothetical protein CN383_11325 [Priestia megaterium]|nr:hypothetical protein CN383_11325 [Priestia megaterium]